MKLLAIETSCDETAIAVLEAEGTKQSAQFKVLGNALLSQIDIHREYGGVFPAIAKREHAKNLVPLLEASLAEAELLQEDTQTISDDLRTRISTLLEREPELDSAFFASLLEMECPDIDVIAVTAGPGLEPALWVGVNFAKALSLLWDMPLVAVNHMEGHILSALSETDGEFLHVRNLELPILALLISGGHTELVLMRDWLTYELVGQTKDDAVGEAYDKVARMMGLPYPGGPEISKLAEQYKGDAGSIPYKLPRPMLHDATCDFSFSGLKTAVLYHLKEHPELTEEQRDELAHEFENAVSEVLQAKTARALEQTNARMLVLGGGVSANTRLRRDFPQLISKKYSDVALRIPSAELTTDNAIMIGIAGFFHALQKDFADITTLRANGNQTLV